MLNLALVIEDSAFKRPGMLMARQPPTFQTADTDAKGQEVRAFIIRKPAATITVEEMKD